MTDRTYFIGFMGALVAHVAILVATRLILDRNEDAVWRFLVALAPIFTAALIVLIGVSQFSPNPPIHTGGRREDSGRV